MPKIKEYDRQKAYEYAKKWAFKRNPDFFDFAGFGGDCTNFISQCLYAGTDIMNYGNYPNWFYINPENRSPSWAGVEYLFIFLTENIVKGPFGKICNIDELEVGDIVQLKFFGRFSHSLFITKILKENNRQPSDILIATHTFDAFDKPVSKYVYSNIRYIKILGAYE